MDQTAYRWGYGRHRMRKKFKRSKREWITERASNSGVFLNLPNPELCDEAWEAEVEARMDHARGVLVEFRDLLRAGRPLPDLDAERLAKARATIDAWLARLDGKGDELVPVRNYEQKPRRKRVQPNV